MSTRRVIICISTYKHLQLHERRVYKKIHKNRQENRVCTGCLYIIIDVDAHHCTFSLAVRRSTGTGRPFSSVAAAAAAACA